MRPRARAFLRESVVLFGFLNGLFLAFGVSPGASVLAVVREVADDLTGGSGSVRFVLTWLPLALVGVALYLIHRRAGWWGFVAVGLAFFSGLSVLVTPVPGLVLLGGALVVGYFAAR